MHDELSEWAHLWTTEAKNYVLLGSSSDQAGLRYSIFDLKRRGFLIIEDDALALRISEQMRRAGIPVVDKPPPDPIDRITEEMFAAGMTLKEINRKRRELFDKRMKDK